MALHQALTPDLEAQAQELVARLRPRAEAELLALARLLVSKEDRDLFGDRPRSAAGAAPGELWSQKAYMRPRSAAAPGTVVFRLLTAQLARNLGLASLVPRAILSTACGEEARYVSGAASLVLRPMVRLGRGAFSAHSLVTTADLV